MSEKESAQEIFGALIKGGAHAVIVTDAALTTVQPLTKTGLEAIRGMLTDLGAPA